MIVLQQLLQGPDAKLLVDQHGDAIADRKQTVEIVRDHEYGKAQAAPQIPDQDVEFAGRYRIEPGGGLVEKDDFRVERKGARKPGPLAHSPR